MLKSIFFLKWQSAPKNKKKFQKHKEEKYTGTQQEFTLNLADNKQTMQQWRNGRQDYMHTLSTFWELETEEEQVTSDKNQNNHKVEIKH